MAVAFNVFTKLFTQIDTLTATFVTDVSSKAITTASPFITVGLTLSFLIYSTLIIRGVIDDPLRDFLFRCLKIGIIVSIGTTGGLYQTQIASAIQTVPDGLATALLTSNTAAETSAGSLLDKTAGAGAAQVSKAFSNVGLSKTGFLYGICGVIEIIATAVLTAIGAALIVLAKVALAILAGLGPIFIFLMLFKSTARFFESWMGQVCTYSLLIVLVSPIFGFSLNLFGTFMNNLAFDGTQNWGANLIGIVILPIVCVFLLLQAPQIAGALANGVGLGLWHEARTMMGMGKAAAGAPGSAMDAIMGGKQSDGSRSGGVAGAAKGAYNAGKKAAGHFKGSRR